MKCTKCGSELRPNAVFCDECGVKVQPNIIRCKECGYALRETSKFCDKCGAKVDFTNSPYSNTPREESFDLDVVPVYGENYKTNQNQSASNDSQNYEKEFDIDRLASDFSGTVYYETDNTIENDTVSESKIWIRIISIFLLLAVVFSFVFAVWYTCT